MDTSSSKIITSITLASPLLSRLDQYAEAEERSRSWVISKAVEQFLQNSATSSRWIGGQSESAPPTNNSDDQRDGPFHPPRLVEPPVGVEAPATSVGAFHVAHAARQAAVKRRQEAAQSEARNRAMADTRNYFQRTE